MQFKPPLFPTVFQTTISPVIAWLEAGTFHFMYQSEGKEFLGETNAKQSFW